MKAAQAERARCYSAPQASADVGKLWRGRAGLEDAKLRTLKTPGKHFDGSGLYLELTAAGGRYWRLKYRHEGKEKRLAFGVYPGVSLKDEQRGAGRGGRARAASRAGGVPLRDGARADRGQPDGRAAGGRTAQAADRDAPPRFRSRRYPTSSPSSPPTKATRSPRPRCANAHGFRALFSTVANERGHDSDVIERHLAHVERNKIRAAYHRAEYLAESAALAQWWADHLDGGAAGSWSRSDARRVKCVTRRRRLGRLAGGTADHGPGNG